MALKQYSLTKSDLTIESFIENYSNKSMMELIPELTSDVELLERIRPKISKHPELPKYIFEEYFRYARTSLSIIYEGFVPPVLKKDEISRLKPIILYLVEKGDLKKEILTIFQ